MTKPAGKHKRVKVAILGCGNIGIDLMYKLLKGSERMDLALVTATNPESKGLMRAQSLGVATTSRTIEAVLADHDIHIVFDATSATAHADHAPLLQEAGKIAIDLTPAALGPYVVPSVNLGQHLDATNVNLITCGGQATIPLVYAVSRVTPVQYAEIVSTAASCSAGRGTRQNIDEFTFTTARGLEAIGQADKGKAIVIFNAVTPPILMRNTVYVVLANTESNEAVIQNSLARMVAELQEYVPGYKLKSAPICDIKETPWGMRTVVTMLVEVAGIGDYLPSYAGNLDIMTSAAHRVGEIFATHLSERS